jgi:hypothetical protein
LPLPNPLRAGPLPLERQGDQLLIASGGSKTVSVTVQTLSADCPCGDAGTVGIKIYSISADSTCDVAVAIFICAYPLVTERKFSIHKVPLETYMSKLWVYLLTTPSKGFLIQAQLRPQIVTWSILCRRRLGA